MVRKLHSLLLSVILLTGCASFPQWSDQPRDCNDRAGKYAEGWNKDVVTGVQKSMARKYICVDNPEVVKLPSYLELLALPKAQERPIVAVYQFQDKTGQRKAREGIADFSTAVTQGGVEMVIDALKTAGGGTWFRVAERNGIDHLVRERQIIRSARDDYARSTGETPQGLQPLLFAGMIIEGGVIGYDTNLKSGGTGARYLGIGATKQYREDTVTVSLRTVSVSTGEILMEVLITKTILSVAVNQDVFRFIEMGTELVEVENGVTKNESVTIALQKAIETGVYETILEGNRRGYWSVVSGEKNETSGDKP